jgi:hypothetical protein
MTELLSAAEDRRGERDWKTGTAIYHTSSPIYDAGRETGVQAGESAVLSFQRGVIHSSILVLGAGAFEPSGLRALAFFGRHHEFYSGL